MVRTTVDRKGRVVTIVTEQQSVLDIAVRLVETRDWDDEEPSIIAQRAVAIAKNIIAESQR